MKRCPDDIKDSEKTLYLDCRRQIFHNQLRQKLCINVKSIRIYNDGLALFT